MIHVALPILGHDLIIRDPRVQVLVRQDVEEDRADRVDVGGLVVALPVERLRWYVPWSAEYEVVVDSISGFIFF